MRKIVYKYELVGSRIDVAVPSPIRKVLRVSDDSIGIPHVWVELWNGVLDDPRPRYRFTTVGTGTVFDDDDAGEHVGTFLSGPFVWHVYMRELGTHE